MEKIQPAREKPRIGVCAPTAAAKAQLNSYWLLQEASRLRFCPRGGLSQMTAPLISFTNQLCGAARPHAPLLKTENGRRRETKFPAKFFAKLSFKKAGWEERSFSDVGHSCVFPQAPPSLRGRNMKGSGPMPPRRCCALRRTTKKPIQKGLLFL